MSAFCPRCWNEVNPGDNICSRCSYRMRDYDDLSYERKLLNAIAHPIRETRILAIQLLGELRSTSALPAFESILPAEEDVYVIREIARSLARIGNDKSLALLTNLKNHKASLVWRLADELLREVSQNKS